MHSPLAITTDCIRVKRLQRLGPYRLKLWFSDGTAGERDVLDLAERKQPITQPFKDPAYFDRVFLEFGALTWPSGHDRAPDALHADTANAGVLRAEKAVA